MGYPETNSPLRPHPTIPSAYILILPLLHIPPELPLDNPNIRA